MPDLRVEVELLGELEQVGADVSLDRQAVELAEHGPGEEGVAAPDRVPAPDVEHPLVQGPVGRREHDALAITDEIYEHIVFDGLGHTPIATLPGMADRTVTISGRFSMATTSSSIRHTRV